MVASIAALTTKAADANGESKAVAKEAGLRYVSDHTPGITRKRRGKGFVYLDPTGKPVRAAEELARIRSLAVPPAWTDVWICPDERGHIQATGRDAKGRKQYRYHERWRQVRDATKYERLAAFGRALPALRARVDRDLSLQGMSREKVVATVVRLLDKTLVRIGNDEYARTNESFGLTTMRNDHVAVRGETIRFEFKGKSGKTVSLGVDDPRAARVVRRCQDLPGLELFGYIDDAGEHRDVASEHVNDYIREATGEDFTAKDFRTWGATVLAARALREVGPFRSQRQGASNVNTAMKAVSSLLGNTVAVCRRSYVHPLVVDLYLDGTLFDELDGARRLKPVKGLRRDEVAVLRLLERAARRTARGERATRAKAAAA